MSSAKSTQALEGTIDAAKARNYYPTYFMKMLAEYGGVKTAKRLLASKQTQSGLFELYHLDLLHESMEAVVLQEKYRPLFTEDEFTEAHWRLKKLDYFK